MAEALAIVRGAAVSCGHDKSQKREIVQEAHAILRGALLADKELRDAWIASIASVFEGDEDLGEEGDEDEYLEPEDVAEEILAHIIGMEM